MDQVILAVVFSLSLLAGVAVLVKPVWDLISTIINYLRFVTRGPFPVDTQTPEKKSSRTKHA